MKKVLSGRVTKPSPRAARAAAPAPGAYAKPSNNDGRNVKEESIVNSSDDFKVRGNVYSNGNGYADQDGFEDNGFIYTNA